MGSHRIIPQPEAAKKGIRNEETSIQILPQMLYKSVNFSEPQTSQLGRGHDLLSDGIEGI